jgi:predicted ATPase
MTRGLQPRTDILGRTAELTMIQTALTAGTRIITIVGAPGAGKTRLARAVLAARGEGAAWFCDLTAATDRHTVLAALADTLGISLPSDAALSSAERLGKSLAGLGAALVILDNVEHVCGIVSELVGSWLDAAPLATFLSTSREPLRLVGERRIEIGSLPVEDASMLYVRSAQAIRASYAPDAAERSRVLELVARLDCLPLAIELAAARVSVLPPEKMLNVLAASRLEVLRAGERDRAARHSSVRAAIDASWALLSGAEAQALAAFSWFELGFDVEAAAAVLDTSSLSASAVLESLVERSLVRSGDAARFALYQSVRDYGVTRLRESGAHDVVASRAASHYVARGEALARAMRTRGAAAAQASLGVERTNFLQVIRWGRGSDRKLAARAALALAPALQQQGPAELYLHVLQEACAAAAGSDDATHAAALVARGIAERESGRMDEARAILERACELARAAGADSVESEGLCALAILLQWTGMPSEAVEACEQAHAAAERAHDTSALARACCRRAWLAIMNEEMSTGERWAARGLDAAIASDDAWALGTSLRWLGYVAWDRGDLVDTRERYTRSLEAFRAAGDLRGESLSLDAMALLEMEDGNHGDALANLDRALALERRGGTTATLVHVGLSIGLVHAIAGREEEAAAQLREIAEAGSRAGLFRLASIARAIRAACLAQLDRTAAAVAELASAVADDRVRDDREVDALLSVTRGVIDAASARAALRKNDRAAAVASVAAARRAATSSGGGSARWVLRVLTRALAAPELAQLASSSRTLTVGPDARWFTVDGLRVELARSGPPRRILLALAERARAHPGSATGPEDAIGIGWPDERILPHAARMRLHTTIRRLRELGLEGLLVTREDGYLIDGGVTVEVAGGAG